MKKLLLAAALWLGAVVAAIAQQTGVPYFPQVVPAGTVIGRSAVSPGPAEAIPFSRLLPLISAGSITFAGNVTAGNVTANTNLAVTGTSTLTGAVTTGGALTTTGALTTGTSLSVATSISWPAKTIVTAPADGQVVMTNAAATGFSGLYLGPKTASFTNIFPSGSGALLFLLGDSSAFSQVETGPLVVRNASSAMTHQLDINGKQRVGATPAPALTSCGTSPTIVGNDHAGVVTMGTGSPTGCVITFNVAYASAPICIVSWQAQALASQSYTVSASAITLTQTGTSSNTARYICLAQSGG